MMSYSSLLWEHDFPDEPVEILSEHDVAGWERRKVEIFRDGSMGYANEAESAHGTQLSLITRPPDDEVVKKGEFQVKSLAKDEFERAWDKARRLALSPVKT